MAICSLHNFLVVEKGCGSEDFDTEINGEVTPGHWRNSEFNWPPLHQQNYGRNDTAAEIRTRFIDYFSSPQEAVSWQDASIQKQ